MRQPEGFVKPGKEGLVCKLKKGVYSLKQSGQVWHQTLKQEMYKMVFASGEADSMVFFEFGSDGSIQLVGWYVNDRLLAAISSESMENMVTNIKGSFEIQNLREPLRLLGIVINRNWELGTIHISQPALINTIAKQFDIPSGRPITSPMDPLQDLQPTITIDEMLTSPMHP